MQGKLGILLKKLWAILKDFKAKMILENNINFLKNYHSKYKNIIYFGDNIYQKIDFNIKSYSQLPKGNQIFINCF